VNVPVSDSLTPPAAQPAPAPEPPAPAARVAPRRPRARVAQVPTRAIETPAVDAEAEARLVEAARSALRTDPARALGFTLEHTRAYPTGVLTLEREALAIHALVLLSRQPEARARLQAFEARYPRSIHVTRLHRVLRDAGAVP
jgi:hypothetical protein